MNLRTLLCTIAVIATLLLLVGCSPDRGSTDLSPIVYISETSQLRLARELLFRSYELTRMIADIQNGFALPSPQRDSSFHLTDNGYYVRTEYDTLAEMVRFVPDVWQGAATQADSLFYKWYVFGGDTTSHGVYWYQTQIARLVPASIPPPHRNHSNGLPVLSTGFYYGLLRLLVFLLGNLRSTRWYSSSHRRRFVRLERNRRDLGIRLCPISMASRWDVASWNQWDVGSGFHIGWLRFSPRFDRRCRGWDVPNRMGWVQSPLHFLSLLISFPSGRIKN